jgi:hypothetical protein
MTTTRAKRNEYSMKVVEQLAPDFKREAEDIVRAISVTEAEVESRLDRRQRSLTVLSVDSVVDILLKAAHNRGYAVSSVIYDLPEEAAKIGKVGRIRHKTTRNIAEVAFGKFWNYIG